MQIDAFRQRLRALGAKPGHEARLLRAWLRGQPLDQGGRRRQASADFLPKAVRDDLPTLEAQLSGLIRQVSRHPAADGSARLLLALQDGQTVESVLLPREGVCVSTQVGCAVGCRFCMTGRDGLLRQLGSAEILAQMVLARQLRPVRKVVFMGMGEPAHNLDNVLAAIDILGSYGDLGHKNLVFSTVGDRRVFERLPQSRVKPALAISLHATRPELRAQLLPKAQPIDPAELVELADAYARQTGYPIQYQWTLIAGVNDGDDEIEALGQLLEGRYGLMNFIPYNEAEGGVGDMAFRRPSNERLEAISAILRRHGVLVKLRQSAGQEVAGGCGQLRARSIAVFSA